MSVVLDLGNTALKWGRVVDGVVHEHGRLVHRDQGLAVVLASLPGHLRETPRITAVEVLGGAARRAVENWAGRPVGWVESSAAALGVRSGYSEPARLGADRWAALIAARRLVGSAVLVVNAGTACTVDLLDDAGVHRGGYIAPGLAAMRRALGADTAAVQVEAAPTGLAPGRETRTAVAAGGLAALVGLVRTAEAEARRQGPGAWQILVGGGDAALLAAALGPATRVEPHLVLLGAAALGDHARP